MEMGTLQSLGEPIRVVMISAAAYGKEKEGYRIYAVTAGKPCVLYVIDPHTGTCLHQYELEGSSHCWGLVVGKDGAVYIGGSGYLYRYLPGNTPENLGLVIPGENYLWRLAMDEDGRIYGGCYPGGKVFQYDPVKKEFRDFGVMVEGEQYVRSLDAVHHKLYAGIGTQAPYIVEVDTRTGDKRHIPLPEEARAANKMVYDLNIAYPKMFARLSPSKLLLVYDLEQQQWVDRVENTEGLDVSSASEDGKAYFVKEGNLYAYDLETLAVEKTSAAVSAARGFGWMDDVLPEFPGQSLVSVTGNGGYWIYHPATDTVRHVSMELQGQPVAIQSIAQGPDGNVYAGGYFSGGFAQYDPDTGVMTEYKKLGQTENMIAHQGKMYLGIYPKANIFCYDPAQPWDVGENPRLLFSLQEHQQDRPFAWTSAGEQLVIGTVPDYGQLGGALTVYDPVHDQREVYRNVIANQSVISLAYRDGIVYAGSSIWGGLGIPPSETEAKLLMWDLHRRSMIWETIPVAGEKAISALAFDDEGKLWGLTAGYLFCLDPATRTILSREELFPWDWGKVGHYWRGGFLHFHPDGYLVGTTLQKLFRYDLRTKRLDILDEQASLFASDRYGHLYFARGSELFQYKQ